MKLIKMEQKERWANEVFASIEDMKRANPSDDLFEQIRAKLQNTQQVKIIPLRHLIWAGAAACVMLTVNILALNFNTKDGNRSSADIERILTDFTLYQ